MKMSLSISSSHLTLTSLIFLSFSIAISIPIQNNFLQCLSSHFPTPSTDSQLIYTPNTSSYTSILQSSIQNLRFLGPTTPEPLFIITPTNSSHIQASIICSRTHGLNIRVRSGGHDYEGLSYVHFNNASFIIIDLVDLRSITVDLENQTMWVQSGATVGEVYYQIMQMNGSLAFPAGICSTMGVGGHFGGGGLGTMMRKHGLAADNIFDAYLIDADGRLHDRKSMGEDLFWAIRGGGASSFGVILSWKIKLVHVPPTVTVFTISKTLEQGATKLVERWQSIADKFSEDLFIRLIIQPKGVVGQTSRTVKVLFNSLFLGTVEELLPMMGKNFPELGLEQKDCLAMSWIESVLYFAGLPYGPGHSIDVLLDRGLQEKVFYKGKSDFVEEPISQIGLEGIWERVLEEENMYMIMDPLGGRMSEISAAEIPFPYRRGYLYNIQYMVRWGERDAGEGSKKHIDWIRRLYEYLGPHVSSSPRGAYLNYRDLDLGVNEEGNQSYSTARIWGSKYFNGNFKRLARVKGVVDPTNFFRSEQSIPPLVGMEEEIE
ncbi:tetrahydroberberine oxidase-like [Magnolia sinica]|uniref:tetrahydroberberine oxidase-like n=1 Tax=Magnolia sinica TaxID=86752 RepID=UPI0026596DF9|nr:tetrahydroberberine oxidase-like [Magnolia sinica]